MQSLQELNSIPLNNVVHAWFTTTSLSSEEQI